MLTFEYKLLPSRRYGAFNVSYIQEKGITNYLIIFGSSVHCLGISSKISTPDYYHFQTITVYFHLGINVSVLTANTLKNYAGLFE